MMAIALCGLLGATGLARTMLSQQTSLSEAFAIVISLMVIVFVSILTGAVLPLLLHYFKVNFSYLFSVANKLDRGLLLRYTHPGIIPTRFSDSKWL